MSNEFQNWLADRLEERRQEDLPEPASLAKFANLTAVKQGGYLVVTDEQLMDAGLIKDTRPSWRPTLRYRIRSRWWAARRRAGELIAGERFEE